MKPSLFKPFRYYFSKEKKLYYAIKNIFGFYPGNIFLYKLAFLHKSAGSVTIRGVKVNNERLEFLGDAILDAIVAVYLYKTFPTKDEGFLTEMRSKIVSRSQLNKLSMKLGLDLFIQVETGTTNIFRSSQGDAFEAIVGAMYLDKGFRFTKHVIQERVINQFFDISELVTLESNFKSRIIEWAQKEKKQISFTVAEEVGAGYRKQYLVDLSVNGEVISKGQDFSIKGAEQSAAEKAWIKLQQQQF